MTDDKRALIMEMGAWLKEMGDEMALNANACRGEVALMKEAIASGQLGDYESPGESTAFAMRLGATIGTQQVLLQLGERLLKELQFG